MIRRNAESLLRSLARRHPVVTLTGPRQSGKTTLCRMAFPGKRLVSLEPPDVREFAASDPRGFLRGLPKGGVIDEVQRVPDLCSYIQEDVDADRRPGRWILTGSANLALMRSVSQSLAGRTAFVDLLPLVMEEVGRFPRGGKRSLADAMWRGSYPAVFERRLPPPEWYAGYVRTYVERDLRVLLDVGDLSAFQRFMRLCAGRTGQLLNVASLAADCGIANNTAKAWLSVLEASYVLFRLTPLHANPVKREVKAPKLHFYDAGLACWLLGIRTPDQLDVHPLRGAIFETWVVSEVAKARANAGLTGGLHHFRDRKGREADLVVGCGSDLHVVEVKSGQTVSPGAVSGARSIAGLLGPGLPGGRARAFLIHGGDESRTQEGVTVLPWTRAAECSGA